MKLLVPRQATCPSPRSAPLLLAATVAVWAIGIGAATPAVGDTGASTDTSPAITPSSVRSFTGTFDRIWSQYVPPNSIVPQNPAGAFDQFIEPFIPTTTQARDFFGFIQQFRPPAPVAPPTR